MKVNPVGAYYVLLSKYNKYHAQLQKALKDRSFWRLTQRKRQILIKRLRKLERKLHVLRDTLGIRQAATALSMAAILATTGPTQAYSADLGLVGDEIEVMMPTLSSPTVSLYAPVGSVVGNLGGSFSFTSTGDATDDHNGFFTINSSNDLVVNANLQLAGTNELRVNIGNTPITISISDYPIGAFLASGSASSNIGGSVFEPLVDADNDGDLDLFGQSVGTNLLQSFGTTGDTFSSSAISGLTNFQHVHVADFDSDGDLELIGSQGGYLQVNNATGGSYIASGSGDTANFLDVAVGDIDGDGDVDIVNITSNEIRFLQNNGGSYMTAAQTLSSGVNLYGVQLADMDSDGDLDIVTQEYQQIRIWENTGGYFASNAHVVASGQYIGCSGYDGTYRLQILNGASLGDIDGDGDIDVLGSFYGSNRVFTNNSNTSGFSFVESYANSYYGTNASYGNITGAALVDIDSDGDLDVLSFGGYANAIFRNNNGKISFFSETSNVINPGLLFGDIDGDGTLDAIDGSIPGQLFMTVPSNPPTDIVLTVTTNPVLNRHDLVATATVTDADGGPNITLELASGAGDEHNALFTTGKSSTSGIIRAAKNLSSYAGQTLNIRLRANDGGGGVYEEAFLITLPNVNGVGALTSASLTIGASQDIITIDFDGDGDLDVVQDGILHLADGSGGFGSVSFGYVCQGTSTNLDISQVEVGDLDGDGDLDIAVLSSNPAGVAAFIALGDGSGGISFDNGITNAGSFVDIATGDIDGDGADEILVGESGSFTVFSYGGGYSLQSDFSSSGFLGSLNQVEIADLDGDQDLDILLNTAFYLYVLDNNGGNNFSISSIGHFQQSGGGNPSLEFAIGDIDADGDPDVVMGTSYNAGSAFGRIFLNNGSGSLSLDTLAFGLSTDAKTATDLDLVDFDGDGDLDILLSLPSGNAELVLNCGSFYSSSILTSISNARALDFGDLDGDTDIDIALATASGSQILSNTPSANPTDITIQQTSNPFPKAGENWGLLSVVDSDGPGGIFSLVPGAGSDDNDLFQVGPLINAQAILRVKEDLIPFARQTYNIRVRVIDGGGGSFEKALVINVPLGNTPLSFEDTSNTNALASGNNKSIALADVDGDGELDFIVSDAGGQKNYIIGNDGSGNMGNLLANFGTSGSIVNAVELNDFDDDGDIDLLVAGTSNQIWQVSGEYFSTAGGTVISLSASAIGSSTGTGEDIAIGDLDGDGEKDILIAKGSGGIGMYSKNLVSNAFVSVGTISGTFKALEIADLDNDGDLEALALGESGFVRLDISTSSISTVSIGSVQTGACASLQSLDLELGDFDADGDLDVAVLSTYNTLTLFRNDESLTFTSLSLPGVTGSPSDLAVVDMDGDGDLDILVANNTPAGNNFVLTNDGSLGFSSSTIAAFGGSQQSVDVGDLNSDGTLDFVFGRDGTDVVVHGTFSTAPSDITMSGADNLFGKEIGQVVRTFSVTDPNQASGHTLTLVSGTGDADNSLFTISGTNLLLNADINGYIPTSKTFNIRVRVTDNDSNTFEKSLVVQTPQSSLPSAPGTLVQATGSFGFSSQTYTVSTGDFDNDGDLDLFLGGNNQFAILSNVGTTSGNFNAYSFSSSNDIYRSEVADMDGDGDLDVVVLNEAEQVVVFANNGSAGFTPGQTLYIDNAYNIEVGDLDGDGDMDILVVATTANNAVLINNGSLNFTSGNTFNNIVEVDAKLTDADGDGDLDAIMVGSLGIHQVQYNDGSGSFVSSASFSGGDSPFNVELADLEGDGDLDIIVGRSFSGNGSSDLIYVDGTSRSLSTNSIGNGQTKDIGIADLDNDGDLELIDATFNVGGNTIYGITSAGGPFDYLGSINGNGSAYAIATGDFDGDGDVDIFMANRYQDALYFNEAVPPATVTLDVTNLDPFLGKGLAHGTLMNDGNSSNSFTYELVNGAGDDQNGFFTISGNKLLANGDLLQGDIGTANIRVQVNDVTQNVSSVHQLSINVLLPSAGFAAFGPNVFNSAVSTSGYNQVNVFELGDLDNDGDLDVVIGGQSYLGIGRNNAGVIVDATPYSLSSGSTSPITPGYVSDLALADMDADGDLDIVFKSRSSNGLNDQIAIYHNGGTGTGGSFSFTSITMISSATGSGLENAIVAIGDLDGDGDQDVILGRSTGSSFYISKFEQTATSSFSSASIASGSGTLNEIELADIDADGDLEIVYSSDDSRLYFHFNDGSGNFGTIGSAAILGGKFILADVDGDADLDVVVASQTSDNISVLLNDGGLVTSSISATVTDPSDFDVADFDGDGDLDVIVTTSNSADNAVLLVSGTGGLTSQSILGFNNNKLVKAGKINSDGLVDFVAMGNQIGESRIGINASSPTDISIGFINGTGVDLGAAMGAQIGAVNVTDPGSSTHTLELVAGAGDTHNHFFTLASQNNGNLKLNRSLRRYTGLSSLSIRVRATNEFGVSFDKAVILPLSNTIDNPSPASFVATGQFSASSDRLNTFAMADLDGDGDKDLVSAVSGTTGAVVSLNDGSGNFATGGQTLGSGSATNALDVDLGDLDRDGDVDVVVTFYNGIYTFVNDGSGSFTYGAVLANAQSARSAIGDFDGDGDVDIWTVRSNNASFILLNDGNGSFSSDKSVSTSDFAVGSNLLDIDNDGDLDPIFFLSGSSHSVFIGNNDGSTYGNIASSGVISLAEFSFGHDIGDLDGDGDLDIVTASTRGFRLLRNASGSFNSSSMPIYGNGVSFGDVDGDGDLDMFVTSFADAFPPNSLGASGDRVFLNDGSAGFSTSLSVGNLGTATSGSSSSEALLEDIDGDGDMDILATGNTYGAIDIWFNNGVPTITATAATIFENAANGSTVFNAIGSDADGDNLTYTITAGNDLGIFAINASSGVITIANNSSLDFETTSSYSLTVSVSDGTATATGQLTVNVSNVNEAPVIANATATVAENSATGTTVTTVSASDADGNTLTYSITAGNTDNAFTINSSTGEVTVADGSKLDFETTPSYSLTISASDGTVASTATLTITLTNVNDAPTLADATASIAENSANGTAVTTVTGSDPDGNTLSYSIKSGNTDDVFAIDASTGAITVADATKLNFENTASYTLAIEATDGTASASATLTVTVTDVNEGPTVSSSTFALDENSEVGTSVGSVSASDPESNTLTYSITAGNDAGAFEIDASSGEIKVKDSSPLDFETTTAFTLTISVSDGTNTSTGTVTVNLNNVSEGGDPAAPTYSVAGTASNSAGTAVTGTVVVVNVNDATETFGSALGSDGSFNVTSVGSGTYSLIVIPDDESLVPTYLGGNSPVLDPNATFETFSVNADVTGLTIQVAAAPQNTVGTNPDGGRISFQAVSSTNGRNEIVQGRVVNGDPIPNTLVILYTSDGEFVASSQTDENGFVTFEELPDGEYELVIEIPGVGRESASINVAEGEETEVTGMISETGISLEVGEATAILNVAIRDSEFKIYPNPVKEELTIELSGSFRGDLEVSIMALNGQVLTKKALTKSALKLSYKPEIDLQAGIYLVRIAVGNEMLTKRLIKN